MSLSLNKRYVRHHGFALFSLALFGVVALAACAVGPHGTGINFGDNSNVGQSVHASAGYGWTRHVAVYSVDSELRTKATKIVEGSFGLTTVSVPESQFLVRVSPCGKRSANSICISTQYNGNVPNDSCGIGEKSKSGRHLSYAGVLADNREQFVSCIDRAMMAIGRS